MDEKEIQRLHDQFFKGKISKADRKRLYEAIREESEPIFGEMTDIQVSTFLYVTHPDYGKPDENGIISIV